MNGNGHNKTGNGSVQQDSSKNVVAKRGNGCPFVAVSTWQEEETANASCSIKSRDE
jgi:hypothetical protein